MSGPYDATVTGRNRKLRPIDAFAKDSLNMVMGGGKPNYDKHVHADARNMYGHMDDAVNDYTNAALKSGAPGDQFTPARPAGRRTESFDPTSKIDQVHGDETHGLGTSTFLRVHRQLQAQSVGRMKAKSVMHLHQEVFHVQSRSLSAFEIKRQGIVVTAQESSLLRNVGLLPTSWKWPNNESSRHRTWW